MQNNQITKLIPLPQRAPLRRPSATARAVSGFLWAHVGPVSTGENRNEEADRAARGLTSRGVSSEPRPMGTDDD